MSSYRPLLPVADYSALLSGLRNERNPWFAEVASFTINSDNDDIERDVKSAEGHTICKPLLLSKMREIDNIVKSYHRP